MGTTLDVTTFRPIGPRVLIEPDNVEIKDGRIIIPEGARARPQIGTVVSVGPGRIGPLGERIAPQVAVGDRVVWMKMAGSTIEVDDRAFLSMTEEDLLGIMGAEASEPGGQNDGGH